MPFPVEDQVRGFDVPVDDALRVCVLKTLGDVGECRPEPDEEVLSVPRPEPESEQTIQLMLL